MCLQRIHAPKYTKPGLHIRRYFPFGNDFWIDLHSQTAPDVYKCFKYVEKPVRRYPGIIPGHLATNLEAVDEPFLVKRCMIDVLSAYDGRYQAAQRQEQGFG